MICVNHSHRSPRIWLPTSTLGFGVIMIAHGFAPNWYTLAGLRIPLGAFEGVLFPGRSTTDSPSPGVQADTLGCIFLIASWYPRYATQKRISAFYLGGQLLGGFGNIIAYGFS